MEERLFKLLKRHLKYNNDDFELFQQRPENAEILEKLKLFADFDIVMEVVSARGCNSRHEPGQKWTFDGAGNLLADKSPPSSCIFMLGNVGHAVYSIHELLYAGIPPEKIRLRFPRVGCSDVGVENCGWGKVIAEVSVQPKSAAPKQ